MLELFGSFESLGYVRESSGFWLREFDKFDVLHVDESCWYE